MVEYAGFKRAEKIFPKHWRGITPGQDSEERAAIIIMNMALDCEARGDVSGAEQIRKAFVNGGDHSGRSVHELQEKWMRERSAASALALAEALRGGR